MSGQRARAAGFAPHEMQDPWKPAQEDTMKEVQPGCGPGCDPGLHPAGAQSPVREPQLMSSYTTLAEDNAISPERTSSALSGTTSDGLYPKIVLPPGGGPTPYVAYDESAAIVESGPHAVAPKFEPDQSYRDRRARADASIAKYAWLRHDRKDRKCLALEAAVASLIIVAIVLGVVLGTQLPHKSQTAETAQTAGSNTTAGSNSTDDSGTTTTIVPSEETIPMGTVFNTTITVGGQNCSSSSTCGIPIEKYAAGVSQNLFGEGITSDAWSCGTCWQLKADTDPDGLPIANSSAIVITVVNDCPATPSNDLCLMEDLNDTNVWGANVNFNLCADSGAPVALFGGTETQLGVGRAIRVEC